MIKITGNETEIKVIESLLEAGKIDDVTHIEKLHACSELGDQLYWGKIEIAGIDVKFEVNESINITEIKLNMDLSEEEVKNTFLNKRFNFPV